MRKVVIRMYPTYDLPTFDQIATDKARKGEPSLKAQKESSSLTEAGGTNTAGTDEIAINKAHILLHFCH